VKFWQKTFFLVLLLFLAAFDSLGCILLERSFSLNREYAIQAARIEEKIIEQSVYERIMQLSALYEEWNPDNLRDAITPYGNYYAGQGAYLALYQNESEVSNSNPVFSPPAMHGPEARMHEAGGYLFCVVGDELPLPLESLRLVYMKDASSLLRFKNDMARGFILISVIISLTLSGALLFLLVRLTRPFRELSAAALSIAQGEYGNRAPARGNDEVGQFARSFNLMAHKVQEHIDMLSQMGESRERFINDLAHEMRTPITAISGYAELLKIGNITEAEREKSIDYIIGQSRRMKNMACKLSDLSRMSQGNIEKKPLDVASLVSSAAATCQAQLDMKRIALRKDIGGASIAGDAELIESLLQNLIDNAAKYSEDGGRIDIRAYSEGGEALIVIADRGKGMEEAEIPKITEPFYRVGKSRSRAGGGVGLGLAICARICELHGARLEIKTKPGAGTKIILHFCILQPDDDLLLARKHPRAMM
jgi:signal transduction histidine kinase